MERTVRIIVCLSLNNDLLPEATEVPKQTLLGGVLDKSSSMEILLKPGFFLEPIFHQLAQTWK